MIGNLGGHGFWQFERSLAVSAGPEPLVERDQPLYPGLGTKPPAAHGSEVAIQGITGGPSPACQVAPVEKASVEKAPREMMFRGIGG